MGIIDRIRGRKRVDDIDEARRLADIDNEARERAARQRARIAQEERERAIQEEADRLLRTEQRDKGSSTFGAKILAPVRVVRAAHQTIHTYTSKYSPLLLLLPIALNVLDFFTGFNGICLKGPTGTGCQFFSWDFLNFYIQLVMSGVYWVVVVFVLIFMTRDISWREFVTRYVYYTVLAGLIFAAVIYGLSATVMIHIVFATFVYIYLLKGFSSEEGITSPHWWFLFIFFIDMFSFPALYQLSGLVRSQSSDTAQLISIVTNRLLLPVWFFYTLKFVKEGFAKSVIVFAVIAFYIGYIGGYMYPYVKTQLAELPQEQKDQFIKAPLKALSNYWLGIAEAAERSLDTATGGLYSGLYRGNVEKNKYESLGVYFTNVRASEPRFYTDEPVTVWGTIRSKTYQDHVIVNFKCFKSGNDKRTLAKKFEPKNPFPVFQLEENDVECTFDKELDAGINTIILSAEYNFNTNAYQKAYFIDRDRARAMVRENLDPLVEFGIKDRGPKPVFTNGPVEIGINVPPLVSVSRDYIVRPTISVSLSNRKEIQDKDKRLISKWEGKIKNIVELVILTPPNVIIPNLQDCTKENFEKGKCPCNRPFKDYTVKDCITTCDTQLEPCKTVCQKDEGCKNECARTNERCKEDCNNLFKVEPGEGPQKEVYNGYALDVDRLVYKDEYKDIDRFKTFVCRFEPLPEALDNTPITTRYFRVRARYNYLLENSVKVTVEQAPFTLSPSTESTIGKCSPPDGVDPTFFSTLVKAIAYVESSARHCKTGATSCPKNEVIASDSSVGIMQINIRDSPGSKWVTDASPYCEKGKNVYDHDCNIMLGCKVLKDKYEQFKGGASASVLNKYCPEGEYYRPVYESYKGWDAAIKAYNGWGCRRKVLEKSCTNLCKTIKKPTCVEDCIQRTLDYVQHVKQTMDDIKSGIIKTKEFIPITRAGIQPLENPTIAYEPKENKVTIRWAPYQDPEIMYFVTRYKQGDFDRTFENKEMAIKEGKVQLEDKSIQQGEEYSYDVIAVDNQNNVYASTEFTILIPQVKT